MPAPPAYISRFGTAFLRPYFIYGGTDYTLSGTLQSGTNLKGCVLNVRSGSTFTLQLATPEPGSVALLIGLSVNGLGLLARRKPHPGKP